MSAGALALLVLASSLPAARGRPPPLPAGKFNSRGENATVPKSIALVYHGQYVRRGNYSHLRGERGKLNVACSDAFITHGNQREMLVAPLLRLDVDVRVYFHTVAHCARADAALVDLMRPRNFSFTKQLPHKRDTFVRAGALVPDSDDAEVVMFVRFDVLYQTSVATWGLRWDQLTAAFRDHPHAWFDATKASDLFFAVPRSMLPAFLEAMGQSGDAGHDALARLVDAGVVAKDMIDFVDERRQGSSMVGVDPFQTFLGIERRCDRYYRDAACTTTDPAWGAWRP